MMGYTLRIGNATVESSKEDGELSARWTVETVSHPDAPVFPNDNCTGNRNCRSPSYTTWSEFAQQTGLEQLFYDSHNGLLANHPDCVPLSSTHHAQVLAALKQWQRNATKPPGFSDPDMYDYQLARLLWLEWWIRWALANCETPAFENS